MTRSRLSAPVPHDGPVPPALINFVLTGCKPRFPAYHATILDLAARGFLTATSQPDDIWLGCDAPRPASADTAGLAGYEQLVLGDVSGRLAGTGGAPFRVLAGACQADEQHIWLPFTEALCAEARRRGLSQRRRLSGRTVALVGVATLAAVPALAATPRLPLAAAAGIPVLLALIILFLMAVTVRPDQLTPYGTELATRLAGERAALIGATATQFLAAPADAELGQRADAIAAMIPGAGPEPGGPSRRRTGPAAPAEAWSAFSGTWRLVQIAPPPGNHVTPATVRLAFAAWFALLTLILAVASATRLWSLPFALAAIWLGIRGHARLAAALSQPRRTTFAGQVIARWGDAGQDEHPYCAVDDAERAWAFTAPAVCHVMLDDLVQVTLNLRTGKLIALQVTERQHSPGRSPASGAAGSAGPAGPAACPVSAAEVESLIGPVRRSTPMPVLGGRGTLYQGQNGHVSVTVVSGGTARLAAMISRTAGTPLPGTEAEFWLPNGGRTVAVRSGGTIATVTVSGRGAPRRPDLLTELAAKIAPRLEPPGAA